MLAGLAGIRSAGRTAAWPAWMATVSALVTAVVVPALDVRLDWPALTLMATDWSAARARSTVPLWTASTAPSARMSRLAEAALPAASSARRATIEPSRKSTAPRVPEKSSTTRLFSPSIRMVSSASWMTASEPRSVRMASME